MNFDFSFFVGLTLIGLGSLFALAMIFLYKLTPRELVGADIAHAFLLVSEEGIMPACLGNVDYLFLFNLLVGSISGVMLGNTLFSTLPAN
jgi:uncharacterized protein